MDVSDNSRSDVWDPGYRPYIVAIVLLLCLCGVRGYWLVHDLPFPPYEDSLRDLGLMQGIIDGDFFHDPINAGAWQWYPPLIHFLGAAAIELTGSSPVRLWLTVAPWLNLLAPATFFLMSARLVGVPAAVFATFAFVFLNGALIAPWDTATYVPWPYTPIPAEAFFFVSVLIFRRSIASASFFGATLSGAAIGLTFLAHAIPGLVLVPVLAAGAVTEQGPRLRTLIWLVVAGTVAAGFALLFVGPLIFAYRLQILNPLPTALAFDELLVPNTDQWLRIIIHLPALVALVFIAILGRKALDRGVVAILGAWILACVAALARHFACYPYPTGSRRCDMFAMPVQHFHVYLQAAEAVLVGYGAWLLYAYLFRRPAAEGGWPAWIGRAIIGITLVIGSAAFLTRPYDREMIARVDNGTFLDFGLYQWIMANTDPHDLFVTYLPEGYGADQAALSVFAAGRRLVAAPSHQSNPYLDWVARNQRRQFYYQAALDDSRAPGAALCRLLVEAGPGAAAYVIISGDSRPNDILGRALFQSKTNALFEVDPARIDSAPCS